MKWRGWLRWGGWATGETPVRRPSRLDAPRSLSPVSEASLRLDVQTLHQVIEGLHQLQQRAEHTEIAHSAEARGYLTPEEDDRVRQGLLAYRNYRLALYEIILRLEHYSRLRPAGLRLRAFLVALASALTLYAKSLRLDALAGRSKLIRAKLNEPEPRFDLEQGFFDEVMAGFCSLRNYGLILRALWFWITRRRAIRSLARLEPDPWAWLERLVVQERRTVQNALNHLLRRHLRQGWRHFWQTAFKPVNRIQYDVRARVGGRFAGSWLHPAMHRPLDESTLRELGRRLRPGDVLLTRAEGKLTAALLPGFWSHAAIYLGHGEELAVLDRSLRSQVEDTGGVGWVIEGVSPCVRTATLRTCLDADHALVLRAALPPERIREALIEAMSHLGKEYDFEFDFNLSNRLVCTGLVYRSYQGRGGIEFQLIKRLGNYTLTGDDLAAQALTHVPGRPPGFTPATLVLRRQEGWQFHDDPQRILTLLCRIRKGWRPVRSPKSEVRAF